MPLTCRPSPRGNLSIVLPVGDVGPAGLLGCFGRDAVVDRLGVQQSGAAVDLELLGRTSEEQSLSQPLCPRRRTVDSWNRDSSRKPFRRLQYLRKYPP